MTGRLTEGEIEGRRRGEAWRARRDGFGEATQGLAGRQISGVELSNHPDRRARQSVSVDRRSVSASASSSELQCAFAAQGRKKSRPSIDGSYATPQITECQGWP